MISARQRERVESYKVMSDDIERQVGRINGEFGRVGTGGIGLVAAMLALWVVTERSRSTSAEKFLRAPV